MPPTIERFALTGELPIAMLAGVMPSASMRKAISGIARFGHTQAGELCFCDHDPGAEYSEIAPGSLVLCTDGLAVTLGNRFPGITCLPVPDPRSLFIDLGHRLLAAGSVVVSDAIPRPFGIHPNAQIGAYTDIHPETRIDEGVHIGAHCVIHRGTWIQAGTLIRDNTMIGVAGINAYRGLDGKVRNFPHFASVIIGPGVEIGAGTVVVRGITTSTRIGVECVIGNLCNIGHGVELGERVWLSVGTLVGGHTRIHDGATLGMSVAVKDNIVIGAGAQIGMGSVVVKSVPEDASMFGNPARRVAPIHAGPVR
ncbi:MAG: hypothetical protein Q8Q28_16700 [Pseudomonadota bacterium]|nr:hypothetical protein [Pseudomonadota bacterium]